MKRTLDFVLWLCAQMPIGLVGALLMFLGRVWGSLCRGYTRHVYYPVVVLRRRLRGVPLWQEIDGTHLNIWDGAPTAPMPLDLVELLKAPPCPRCDTIATPPPEGP